MITDAPYAASSLILKPLEGIFAGIVSVLGMIGVMCVLQSFYDGGPTGILVKFGELIPGAGVEGGVFLFLLGGSVFGVLYALCEQRIPTKGLIGNGLFYGFFIWVLIGIILAAFLGEEWRSTLRAWPFLVELLVFGLCLSLFSIVAMKFRSGGSALPRD